MFKKNTVIVLGAGAGVDFNFPIGSKLKTKIAELMSVRRDSMGKLFLSNDLQRQLFRALEANQS